MEEKNVRNLRIPDYREVFPSILPIARVSYFAEDRSYGTGIDFYDGFINVGFMRHNCQFESHYYYLIPETDEIMGRSFIFKKKL